VGNGSDIDVLKDPWIPRPSSFKVISLRRGASLCVADLIDHDRHIWDIQKINESLLPIDGDQILSIPLSSREAKDNRWWFFDKRGNFSVKSGYRVALEEYGKKGASSSGSTVSKQWWITLWNLHIPPKVKIFVWRACLEALPTKANLLIRNITRDGVCGECLNGIEFGFHALFECNAASQVWASVGLSPIGLSAGSRNTLEVMLAVLKLYGRDRLECVCMLMWEIWGNYNYKMHSGGNVASVDVVGKVLGLLEEFQKTNRAMSGQKVQKTGGGVLRFLVY